jgi:crotonobetainyl-CoA:carnitine CoA-transferase CaiB-like acyl-CoA transferase
MYYPTEFSETRVTNRHPAPRLGEHTEELLREVGYEQPRIDELIAQGIAVAAPK